MSALNDLSKLARDANNLLLHRIERFNAARAALNEAHQEQGVTIRALAAVKHDSPLVHRGQELELRAVKTLANVDDSEGGTPNV